MRQKSARKTIYIYLAGLSILILLISSIFFRQRIQLGALFIFAAANALILIIELRSFSSKSYQAQALIENCQVQVNILNVENAKSKELAASLKSRITRYDNLKKIIEDLNRSLVLDSVVDVLTQAVYSLISARKGSALFFLVNKQAQKLELIRSIKEDDEVILAKDGDTFDQWVLRHSAPLLIEDLKKDFRFDTDLPGTQDLRPPSSIISSPLISRNSLLGLLRLENSESGFFTQDDLRFLALVSDLGAVALENSLLFQKTQDLAIHDDLTRLYTRHYFLGRLNDEAKRCLRLDQHLSLMMIDIDFFKQYNDRFGHTAGDIVLKKIASLMKESLSELNFLISRFGGEEFLVMLSGLDKKKSLAAAETLRRRIEKEKISLRRQDTMVTVSIGVASIPFDTKDEDDLVLKADKAMYNAKQKGRNQVCCI
ncbi:sensor domain-containing diguanylate cyclase [bacterium]|nr:MAG: sensor domain-containing diguanylate cyclase [bacterium]